jgi:membrane protein DedA with SNARE-associated domain
MDYLIFFGLLFSYLLLYKYVALFVFILLAGIGLPIPSSTLLLAVGAFSSQGYFNLPLSLAIALIANILGDLFDYFLMRKYGPAILRKNYHKRFSFIVKLEKYIKYLDEYIKNHQRTAIFITRFLGSASTVVNFLSGLTPVPFKTFILYDALGNFLSITFIVFLGFFISESWQSVAGIIGITSTIISVLVLLILAIIVIKKFSKPKYQE